MLLIWLNLCYAVTHVEWLSNCLIHGDYLIQVARKIKIPVAQILSVLKRHLNDFKLETFISSVLMILQN